MSAPLPGTFIYRLFPPVPKDSNGSWGNTHTLSPSASYYGGGVFREDVSYYCAQYIHQATQGESKRVTNKYITVS